MNKHQLAEFFEKIGFKSLHAQVLFNEQQPLEDDETDYQYLSYHTYPFEFLAGIHLTQLHSNLKLKSATEALLDINYSISASADSIELKEPYFDGTIQCLIKIDIPNKLFSIQEVLESSATVNTYEEDIGTYVFKDIKYWFEDSTEDFLDLEKFFTYIKNIVISKSTTEQIRLDIYA